MSLTYKSHRKKSPSKKGGTGDFYHAVKLVKECENKKNTEIDTIKSMISKLDPKTDTAAIEKFNKNISEIHKNRNCRITLIGQYNTFFNTVRAFNIALNELYRIQLKNAVRLLKENRNIIFTRQSTRYEGSVSSVENTLIKNKIKQLKLLAAELYQYYKRDITVEDINSSYYIDQLRKGFSYDKLQQIKKDEHEKEIKEADEKKRQKEIEEQKKILEQFNRKQLLMRELKEKNKQSKKDLEKTAKQLRELQNNEETGEKEGEETGTYANLQSTTGGVTLSEFDKIYEEKLKEERHTERELYDIISILERRSEYSTNDSKKILKLSLKSIDFANDEYIEHSKGYSSLYAVPSSHMLASILSLDNKKLYEALGVTNAKLLYLSVTKLNTGVFGPTKYSVKLLIITLKTKLTYNSLGSDKINIFQVSASRLGEDYTIASTKAGLQLEIGQREPPQYLLDLLNATEEFKRRHSFGGGANSAKSKPRARSRSKSKSRNRSRSRGKK